MQDFIKRLPTRRSRRFSRVFSIVFFGVVLLIGGLASWFVYDQTTWSEAEAEVVRREPQQKGVDLGVGFDKPDGALGVAIVREWTTVRAVGDKVRIRYALNSAGEVRNARLTEEPIVQPLFFVIAGVFLLIGLGWVYQAWWRMPADKTAHT